MKTLSIIGNHVVDLGSQVYSTLSKVILMSQDNEYDQVLLAPRAGFSAAYCCLEHRIPYQLIVPYLGYEPDPEPLGEVFRQLQERSYKVVVVDNAPNPKRTTEKWIINQSDLIVFVHPYNQADVHYAMKKANRSLTIITPGGEATSWRAHGEQLRGEDIKKMMIDPSRPTLDVTKPYDNVEPGQIYRWYKSYTFRKPLYPGAKVNFWRKPVFEDKKKEKSETKRQSDKRNVELQKLETWNNGHG